MADTIAEFINKYESNLIRLMEHYLSKEETSEKLRNYVAYIIVTPTASAALFVAQSRTFSEIIQDQANQSFWGNVRGVSGMGRHHKRSSVLIRKKNR
jgi:hypothetical protein